ncbi:O-succinylbenzoate synthase [Paramicrobacterium humi]|uniref:o-succinylbenzoate synthase n=1 Tax=Paramicrobacterium humi TaxID=640635 RepID=A0A1H4JN26_9MICO|nr:o-succinylbenzoate synthase [Microbacterium humi]SEB47721.1 O-succinylbenzoate synthase [Microbacterium humi]
MRPSLDDLLASAHVVSLPLTTRFRGIDVREALIMRGPNGATEFSPFVEYDDAEAAVWLQAALEFGWGDEPTPVRERIPVNATVPAVPASGVAAVLGRYDGCRTAKVKVAERGQILDDDVARVREVRRLMGPEGRVRVDANGGWNVDEAERAVHALAEFDIEYVEQPCASVDELAEYRRRTKYLGIPVAADESVRKASDPVAVAKAGAADLLIIKAQPLGGVRRALRIVEEAGLPVTVSSALDTSVGLSLGAFLAASVPDLEFDCGLATASLLAADVTEQPLRAHDGAIDVRRVDVSEALLDEHAASRERTAWWLDRLARCYAVLGA